MINKIGQVMLYVDNQDASRDFWTEKLGFEVIVEETNGPMRWIEVAPKGAATSIVLHSKELVAKMNPGMNLGTPSMMYFTDNFDALYSDLKNKNIKVGDIVQLPSGRVFNFADNEENYFAVSEKK
ncbi:VOC family protein [Paenibacillus herberti]|uniref:Glyoxalase/bleomycin resistance/extradiol dioxygenase family protein n=1 Tax=Paenibacillus herberti TaxID=1619309 RepID=A0A229P6F3_9BACL|nr:VOC family protein [Paenibacillus herberti]OXM17515.1 glyoxalase/bleomycin resistance/extradiol dioxygenase family protein [Paenibacillus herberti]